MIVYRTFFPSPSGELKGALLVENLGYKPDTPVQKGIERFIEWYKSYFPTHSK
jgi:nucleoside-diphosphate-sugar epimerase